MKTFSYNFFKLAHPLESYELEVPLFVRVFRCETKNNCRWLQAKLKHWRKKQKEMALNRLESGEILDFKTGNDKNFIY